MLTFINKSNPLVQWSIRVGVFILVLIASWTIRRIIFQLLRRWSRNTPTTVDDILIDGIRAPLLIWLISLGLYAELRYETLPPEVDSVAGIVLTVLLIGSLTIAAAQIISGLIRTYTGRLDVDLPATSLTQNLASIAVIALGALILLNTLGISITPILTALGVGGLAVALALQDTLANLFAGFYISLAGQYCIGDFVQLDSGQEGYIIDINWRSTSLRALSNHVIVIPNGKLAQAIVRNYNLPEKRISLSINVSVSYDCDPDQIEHILVEEAKAAAGHVTGLLAEPEPFVRFIPGFGDSSLDFTLNCQVGEYVDQYLVQHELRKRIFKRFRREGIEIPFPMRTVVLRRETKEEHTSPEATAAQSKFDGRR